MATALGISEQSGIRTINNLLFEIGQGATDGPPGWTYHTNMIIALYNKIAGGCKMQNPTREIQ
eukprot:2997076-Ditylum_brightwellii.AAC.1